MYLQSSVRTWRGWPALHRPSDGGVLLYLRPVPDFTALELPALVGQLQSRNLIRFRYAAYCRSNVSKLALHIGSFRPGGEVCDLISVGALALRTCSHRHRLCPFHN